MPGNEAPTSLRVPRRLMLNLSIDATGPIPIARHATKHQSITGPTARRATKHRLTRPSIQVKGSFEITFSISSVGHCRDSKYLIKLLSNKPLSSDALTFFHSPVMGSMWRKNVAWCVPFELAPPG